MRAIAPATTTKEEALDAGDKDNSKQETVVGRIVADLSFAYVLYSLFGMIAWVSHLGGRLPWMRPFLTGYGYATNTPVSTIADLFKYNGLTALLFVLPHSLLRPPQLIKYIGLRYARAVYCAIAAGTCHMLIAFWRPLDMSLDGSNAFSADYAYNEEANVPLFTLPVPKIAHDILSLTMLVYSFYCFVAHPHTYTICGYNRARYGQDKFPKGLSPRIDIITWCGYVVWLKAGSLGFILFSGLSILPYKVYTWDIVLRVVAAAYLRYRSQGFRLWVGKIEHTHLFIWVLRAGIVVAALGYQYTLIKKGNSTSVLTENMLTPFNLGALLVSSVALALLLHKLEKIN